MREPIATWFLALEPLAILTIIISTEIHGGWNPVATGAAVFAGAFLVVMGLLAYYIGGSPQARRIRENYPNVDQYLKKHRSPKGGVACHNCGGRYIGGYNPDKQLSLRVHFCRTCDVPLYWTK